MDSFQGSAARCASCWDLTHRARIRRLVRCLAGAGLERTLPRHGDPTEIPCGRVGRLSVKIGSADTRSQTSIGESDAVTNPDGHAGAESPGIPLLARLRETGIRAKMQRHNEARSTPPGDGFGEPDSR